MDQPKKIYFASDVHLGSSALKHSRERELLFVSWLNQVKKDAAVIFLLGDIFDFWYEYKHTVPKGFTRLLGKLAFMADKGIKIHIFTGNHDLWMRGYLSRELGAEINYGPVIREIEGKRFYIAHGDGLGPGDHGFKFMKTIFKNKMAQWFFSRIHPNAGISMANYFSRKSRAQTGVDDYRFYGEDKEWLIIHSKELLKKEHIDYFIYGHRHYPLVVDIGKGSKYVNLGDWIKYFSYAEWDGNNLALKYFEK